MSYPMCTALLILGDAGGVGGVISITKGGVAILMVGIC
jgi:hypothetical protein